MSASSKLRVIAKEMKNFVQRMVEVVLTVKQQDNTESEKMNQGDHQLFFI